MQIISVSGATSRSGKTSLAVTLFRALPPGASKAVKFTTTEDEHVGCARGSPCTVCDIDVDFRIVTDPAIIEQEGTDTARLAASGAAQVLWCIARVSALERAWKAVLERLSPHDTLVIEGSTVLQAVSPDLSFFVINPALPLNRWKQTARQLIPACDFVCINIPPHKKLFRSVDESLGEARRIRGRDDILLVDVQQSLSSWPTPEPYQRLHQLQTSDQGSVVRGQ